MVRDFQDVPTLKGKKMPVASGECPVSASSAKNLAGFLLHPFIDRVLPHDCLLSGKAVIIFSLGVEIKAMLLKKRPALEGVKSQEQITMVEQTDRWTGEEPGLYFNEFLKTGPVEQPGEVALKWELELQPC